MKSVYSLIHGAILVAAIPIVLQASPAETASSHGRNRAVTILSPESDSNLDALPVGEIRVSPDSTRN